MSRMSKLDIERLNLKKEKVNKVVEHLRTIMDEISKDNLTYTDSLLLSLKIMQQYDPTECNDSKELLMEVAQRVVDEIYEIAPVINPVDTEQFSEVVDKGFSCEGDPYEEGWNYQSTSRFIEE